MEEERAAESSLTGKIIHSSHVAASNLNRIRYNGEAVGRQAVQGGQPREWRK